MHHPHPSTLPATNPRSLKKRRLVAGAAVGVATVLGIGTVVALSDTPTASADVSPSAQTAEPTPATDHSAAHQGHGAFGEGESFHDFLGGDATFTFETDDGPCQVSAATTDGNRNGHDFDLDDFDLDLGDFDLDDFDLDLGDFTFGGLDADDGRFSVSLDAGDHTFTLECSGS